MGPHSLPGPCPLHSHHFWVPVHAPSSHPLLTCRDPGRVAPPLQVSQSSGDRCTDLQTRYRTRAGRSGLTGTLVPILNPGPPHPTFSSTPSRHFFSGFGHQTRILCTLYLGLHVPLPEGNLPHPFSIFAQVMQLHFIDAEYEKGIISRMHLRFTVALQGCPPRMTYSKMDGGMGRWVEKAAGLLRGRSVPAAPGPPPY